MDNIHRTASSVIVANRQTVSCYMLCYCCQNLPFQLKPCQRSYCRQQPLRDCKMWQPLQMMINNSRRPSPAVATQVHRSCRGASAARKPSQAGHHPSHVRSCYQPLCSESDYQASVCGALCCHSHPFSGSNSACPGIKPV